MTELRTVEDTRAFGRQLASSLRAGDLVVLSGPLGAGKTALAQGIGAGLGVSGLVCVVLRRRVGRAVRDHAPSTFWIRHDFVVL